MTYRTTRRAEQDIIDVYLRGCREFGSRQAELYHAGLVQTFELIADNPRMAREWSEFDPRVGLHTYRSHLIIYMLDDTEVLIVRVLHGRQEWERHL